MIIYRCKCGSTFVCGRTHTSKGKDGKKKHTYMGSEKERRLKAEWKLKHGTHRGSYQNKEELHNPGHGYVRHTVRKKDIAYFQSD
ncbi:MAG: hypothetical protein ACXACF_01630 [Candidatus Hermodarchaeia archaeon]|jgi:hypothetical protein